MRKYGNKLLVMALLAGAFTACSKDDDVNLPVIDPSESQTNGAYVINTGNYNQNNGSIQWYDAQTGKLTADLFNTANGEGIGDVQDLQVYGSKVYAACASSAKIEIMDRNGKRIKKLPLADGEGKPVSPRYLACAGGFVYFTAYDGTVSKLDTLSLEVTGKIAVGNYPEALTAANNKLYVNISGFGKEDKVAVVDLANFTKTKELKVVLNPYDVCLTGEDGKVYFISSGDHGKTINPTLQSIDPATDVVTSLFNANKVAMAGNKIYFIFSPYYGTLPKQIGVYDMTTKETKTFTDIANFKNAGGIVVNRRSNEVFIIDQPYNSLNEVFVYSLEGAFKKKYETGYYTTNLRFL